MKLFEFVPEARKHAMHVLEVVLLQPRLPFAHINRPCPKRASRLCIRATKWPHSHPSAASIAGL